MNNQGSGKFDQIVRFILLWVAATLIFNHFFNRPDPKKQNVGVRTVPALSKAFAGIDPKQGPALTVETGQAEVAKLQKEIEAKGDDEYAYWARLRSGLIQQYVLGKLEVKQLPVSIFSRIFAPLNPPPSEGTIYDEIISHGAADAIDAQAIYQKGSMLYRESTKSGTPPSADAAKALELLIHRGRGASAFLELKILVPQTDAATGTQAATPAPALGRAAIPELGFIEARVNDLRISTGNPNHPDPPGILERINDYYATTTFYKVFDGAVKLLGNNPAYSYGLALILFSSVTRLIMQPLYKKQYENMKGMQIIQPEMKKIQEKYKGKTDQQEQLKMIKEMRELQSKHGVNMQLGCVLGFLQLPIFFLFVYPLIQHFEPKMELVGASFLWVHSLAHSDIPLLILYAFATFVSIRMSSTPPADEQQRMMTMMMTFVMPIMLPFFMKGFSSAFILYWMTFNVLSTILQYRLMKAADPNKSVIKTLMGEAPMTSNESTVAPIPPRPVKKKSNTASASANAENTGNNGSNNGKAAAKPAKVALEKSAFNGTTEALKSNGDSGMNGTATVSSNGSSADGASAGGASAGGASSSGSSGTGSAGNKSNNNQKSGGNRPGNQRARQRRRH